ncbi:MAG: CBS domain-containing protein [Candidatus Thorarchaeota archaeon]
MSSKISFANKRDSHNTVLSFARKRVITCSIDEHLRDVVKKMVDHWISSVVVVDAGKPVGIITDGIIFRLIAKGRNPLKLHAKDVMARPVHTIGVNTSLSEAKKEFLKTKVSRLVIVDDEGNLVGIVNNKDVDRLAAYSLAERMVQHRMNTC